MTTTTDQRVEPSVPSGPIGTPGTPIDFELPAELEATTPPEERGTGGRGDVRLLLGRGRGPNAVATHHRFAELPELLESGDVLVVNRSATLPAAVDLGGGRAVHFSTPTPGGGWFVELRHGRDPDSSGRAGDGLRLPGGAVLRLDARHVSGRLWHARLDTDSGVDVPTYLARHGRPIRYGYVEREWPLTAYQTVFATVPGSAEMPSAGPACTNRVPRICCC